MDPPPSFVQFAPEHLEQLAVDALSSLDESTRTSATTQLRSLSHYGAWDSLPAYFNGATQPQTVYVLCRAVTHIVRNEVGPQERADMHGFLLRWCAERNQGSIPGHVLKQVLRVAAQALFLNFRSMSLASVVRRESSQPQQYQPSGASPLLPAVSSSSGGGQASWERSGGLFPLDGSESDDQPGDGKLGRVLLATIRDSLGGEPLLLVRYAFEIVDRFAEEQPRGLQTVHELFCREALPELFSLALSPEDTSADGIVEVLRLATRCIEVPTPESFRPLVVRHTTEELVSLQPADQWAPMVHALLEQCRSIVRDFCGGCSPNGTSSKEGNRRSNESVAMEALRFVEAASLVGWDIDATYFATGADRVVGTLLDIAAGVLVAYTPDSPVPVDAAVAVCSVLVNLLERHPVEVDTTDTPFPVALQAVCALLSLLCCHWEETEETLLRSLVEVVSRCLAIARPRCDMGMGLAPAPTVERLFGDNDDDDGERNPYFGNSAGSFLAAPAMLVSGASPAGSMHFAPPAALAMSRDPSFAVSRNGEEGLPLSASVSVCLPPAALSLRIPPSSQPTAPGGAPSGGDSAVFNVSETSSHEEVERPTPPPPSSYRRPFDGGAIGACSKAYDALASAFTSYFEAVLSHCHLREGETAEISGEQAEALVVRNEAVLKPVARVLVTCSTQLAPMVADALQSAIGQHELSVRLRRGETLNSEQRDRVSDLLISAGAQELDEPSIALVASRVALSRISVLISVIGLMLQNRGLFSFSSMENEATDDTRLLALVARFAGSFASVDISEMILSLSLDAGGRSGCSSSASEPTFHLGILRALLYFCSTIVEGSGFTEQPVFVACAHRVVTFVMSSYSGIAPVLVADCSELLMAITSDETTSHTFLQDPALKELVRGHILGQIAITNPAEVVQAIVQTLDNGDERGFKRMLRLRKRFVRALARAVDLRVRLQMGPNPFETNGRARDSKRPLPEDSLYLPEEDLVLLYDMLSAADLAQLHPFVGESSGDLSVESALAIFFADVRGLTLGVEHPHALLAVLQWLLNQQELLTLYARQVPVAFGRGMARTCGKVFRRLRSFLPAVDTRSRLPTEFCTMALRLLGQTILAGDPADIRVEDLHALTVMLESIVRGNFVSIGVMAYYGERGVSDCVGCVIRRLVRCDPTDVMSLKHRDAFFEGVVAAFHEPESTRVLEQDPDFPNLVVEMGRLFVRCARIALSKALLQALGVMYSPGAVALEDPLGVSEMVRELAVLLATGSLPSTWLGPVSLMVQRCYESQPAECDGVLAQLLDQASAFHRVRLRLLSMVLRNGVDDLAQAFQSAFSHAVVAPQSIAGW